MGCAGTISWFGTGMAIPERKAIHPSVGLAQRPAVASPEAGVFSNARTQSPWQSDAGPSIPARRTTAGTAPGQAGAGQLGIRRNVEAGAQVEPDWSEVVRRCLSGESPAWTELVRAHHRRVYALCYRFTGSGTDAEDLTQEVFLKIYANLTSFDTARGSLQVWITTLTRNLLVDHFRRTRNLRITGSLDEGWDEGGELRPLIPMDRLEAKGPSQHDQATRRELEKMVQNALAQVSPELREAVILRDLQDMDYKEIAQVLSIPEGTVKSRISRGRAELARLLERNKKEVM
jgi:RNA polymerase sigma-70 factor, ECF subfamily